MKKIAIISLLAFSLVLAQQMNAFCASPPFVGGKNTVVRPNVLICLDMTGSMIDQTAKGDYGYANPDYTYTRVEVGGENYFKKDPAGTYSGFDINETFMTRIDVARKVLTGGKGVTIDNKDTLFFEVPISWNGYTWYGVITTDSTERSKGVIREIADRDDNFLWDSDAAYFALQQFSTQAEFGTQIKCPFGDSLTKFLREIETPTPSGYTWVGNAVFEAIHYIRFCPAHFGGYAWDIDEVGTGADPWYEVVGEETVSVSCRPTFVIVVSDGESNSDSAQGWADCDHLPQVPSPYGPAYNDFCLYNGPDDSDGTNGCADDYAYYAHVVDLRPDNDPVYGIPNDVAEQTITFYSMFLFASSEGANLSRNIAKYGGFNDLNGDKMPGPDIAEWDDNSDGEPDNYFYADEGQELEAAFKKIFVNIMAFSRITSASAGAITTTIQGLKSGGLSFLAQFYPRRKDLSQGLDLMWIGQIEALWLDSYGWLREDTQDKNTLNLKNDYVVNMFFSGTHERVMAARFKDDLGLGDEHYFIPIDTIPAESLSFVWNGAERLTNRDYTDRTIYTNLDGLTEFTPGNDVIDPHLDYGNASQCDSLIDYIRGVDYPNTEYRERQYFGNVWKLGDIIHSSPMPVGTPTEAYHIIYADTTYYDFWDKYQDRRTVIYSGGNDGMLHAFNSGSVTPREDSTEILNIDGLGEDLGSELWAYVPYNILPHLKWLKDTSYCHVYYVDLRPYPTEVQIFPTDADHPHGWGTILVSGMRFGGSEISIEGQGTYRSSYSCFDVTNPEADNYPQLLWEFTDEYLGYTVCVPVYAKITDETGDKWYLLFGSGPQSLYGECTQNARVYVVDPLTGAIVHTIVIPDENTAITNIFSADWGLDYIVDLIYFGTYDNAGGGKIYRINTQQNTDPTTWTLHQVIDLDRPITAEGSVAVDPRGNLWLYFGTGKYFSNLDVADTTVQLFVGIRDDTTRGTPVMPAFALDDLLDVTDVHVFADSVSGMAGVSNFDDLVAEVSVKDGWYRRFTDPPRERVISAPLVFSGAVVFTSFIPGDTAIVQGPDICIGGGGGPQAGNLWALYYLTGTAYKDAILETNPLGERLTHVPVAGDIPSEPAWFLEKIFVQTGGGLGKTEYQSPYDPYGGIMLWRGR